MKVWIHLVVFIWITFSNNNKIEANSSSSSIEKDANELNSYKHSTVTSVNDFENEGWRLPVLPPEASLPPLNQSEKMIPRILWIAVTDKETGITYNINYNHHYYYNHYYYYYYYK